MSSDVIVIYGTGKFQRDFQYMFDDIVPDYYVDDENVNESLNIYPSTKLLTDDRKKTVIICSYEKGRAFEELSEMGLVYGRDFHWAEDFFDLLDFHLAKTVGNRDVAVWGIGSGMEKVFQLRKYERFLKAKTKCLINSNQYDFIMYSQVVLPVKSPTILEGEKDKYFVIVASEWYAQISDKLEEYGYVEGVDFIHSSLLKMKHKPSEMLRSTIYDKVVYGLDCDFPQKVLNIQSDGTAYCCTCPSAFHGISIGNLKYESMNAIWKSNMAKVIRLSVVNKTFTFCNHDCEKLIQMEQRDWTDDEIPEYIKDETKEYSRSMCLALDHVCNKKCPSCRNELIVKNSETEELNKEKMVKKLQKEGWLDHVEKVAVGGDGETFFSKIYQDILYGKTGHKRKTMDIMTNGVLFSKEHWEKLKDRYENVLFSISVDGTKKETYEKLRGSGYERLLDNLQLLSELRKKNEIRYVKLKLIVQRDNYKEMPMLVQWAKDYGFDEVYFSHITNWGTFSEEEFKDISMITKDYKIKEELMSILELPIMKDPIVSLRFVNLTAPKGESGEILVSAL